MGDIVRRKIQTVNRAFPGISGHSDNIDIREKKKNGKKRPGGVAGPEGA
jgi:hypothetical protein